MDKMFEWVGKIISEKEEAFPHEVSTNNFKAEEKDLKDKIALWKANERKHDVLHAIN